MANYLEVICKSCICYLVLLYVYLIRDFPQYAAYAVPDFFASDWLNEVWHWRCDVSDDYQFVYMGPKGTWCVCVCVCVYMCVCVCIS